MNILEKQIEDVVFDALESNIEALDERGFPVDYEMAYVRQLDLGGYGIADIIGFKVQERCVWVDVIELKKDAITSETMFQALRYAKGIERLIERIDPNKCIYFHFYLIGKNIDLKGNFCYATDYFDNLHLYTYSVSLTQGITFDNHSGFYSSNENFGNSENGVRVALNKSILKLAEAEDVQDETDEDEESNHPDDLPF